VTRPLVIDTNVLVVANELHPEASIDCIVTCIDALRNARHSVVLVDDAHEVFKEYRTYCSHSGQPKAGDAFFKWLWDNQSNPAHCLKIPITPHPDRSFEEFPDDPDLEEFDVSDRKFVAVAIASAMNPEVLNASDTDWATFRDSLESNGISIRFLCPELMEET
jgi:hypothetical protein